MKASELKVRLTKSLEHLETELARIRTGRATPALLENIPVEAYGAKITLKEVGTITVSDSQNLLVSPWDKSLLDAIAKVIGESDLNLNPTVGGDSVRVPLPSLTEDRRKEFARLVSSKVEECKTSMRNIRQDVMKVIDEAFLKKELSEDEKFTQKEEVEDIVKDFVSKVENISEKKKSDVMKV